MIKGSDIETAAILETLNLFPSKGEIVEYLILKYTLSTNEPVGAWILQGMLEQKGIDVSTATIGRILKNLDVRGYTNLIDSRGRKITFSGASYIKRLTDKVHREILQKRLMDAVTPHNMSELVELMCARRIIENETAKLAAFNRGKEDLKSLEISMEEHEELITKKMEYTEVALDFHLKVASASKNRFLIAMLEVLIYEEIKLESHFEKLITRERGEEYLRQHKLLVDAIRKRDAQAAEKIMGIHFDSMISDIEKQIEKSGNIALK